MTLAADANFENDTNKVPAVAEERDAGLAPFLAASGADSAEPVAARTIGSRMLDYSAHAAMIVGLVGFAWTVSNHVVKRPAAPQSNAAVHAAATPVAPTPSKPDEMADLRRTNQQMSEDIRRLRSNLDSLRASVREDKTSAQVRVLQAGLENVQSGLTAARNETAQLNGKIEKIVREPVPRPASLNEHAGKSDKTGVDMTSTGSIAPAASVKAAAAVPVPPVKPAPAKAASVKLASAEEPHKAQIDTASTDEAAVKPQVIPGFVVRDVYDGVALIEGRRGTLEVVPGVGIPGAGIVKSIDRKGNGWTVTTTKGLLAYAAPPHDYHRSARPQRDYYPPYREDF